MTSVNLGNTSTVQSLSTVNKPNNKETAVSLQDTAKAIPVESSKVTISDAGKALLDADLKANDQSKTTDTLKTGEPLKTNDTLKTADPLKTDALSETAEVEEPSNVKAFAYGALGLERPEESPKEVDDSFTAGRYLKGALTVGSILLAIV